MMLKNCHGLNDKRENNRNNGHHFLSFCALRGLKKTRKKTPSKIRTEARPNDASMGQRRPRARYPKE
jgi:hypothetical protein